MTNLEEEFNEASQTIVGAYRVLRRLAGEAIIERERLKARLIRIENLYIGRYNAGDTIVLLDDLEDALYTPDPRG